MRIVFEQMVVTNQVELVFAGHVHAYDYTVSPLFPVIFSYLFIRSSDQVAAPFKHPSLSHLSNSYNVS
jgi:hypothetical protein